LPKKKDPAAVKLAGSGEMMQELPGARDNGTVKQQLNPSNAGMCVMDETE
jgi:hypothetical protein